MFGKPLLKAFVIVTYAVIFFAILASFWGAAWQLTAESVSTILLLICYTLLLVLPITKFTLSSVGFQADLTDLSNSQPTPPPSQKEVMATEVEVSSEQPVAPDVVLMTLVGDMQMLLAKIANARGIASTGLSMGSLIEALKRKNILGDGWLLNALRFFSLHRAELVHEGTLTDIEKAIGVAKTIRAQLQNLRSLTLAKTPSVVQLKDIVESTPEGPVIITREKLTHYEAIGVTLYASNERKSTAAQITKILESSGIKCMVPARLSEMTQRGQVFKPDHNKPEFKLTTLGEQWIENVVLSRLKEKMGP